MVDRINSDGNLPSISPHQQKKTYESEYTHAADLFQRTLNEYSKSDNLFQKAEFKKVMDTALYVLKEAASELKRKDLLAQSKQIEQDYQAFQADPTQVSALNTDLDKTKKSV